MRVEKKRQRRRLTDGQKSRFIIAKYNSCSKCESKQSRHPSEKKNVSCLLYFLVYIQPLPWLLYDFGCIL